MEKQKPGKENSGETSKVAQEVRMETSFHIPKPGEFNPTAVSNLGVHLGTSLPKIKNEE